jgi:transcriptional regulator with XRE-family HTH domain
LQAIEEMADAGFVRGVRRSKEHCPVARGPAQDHQPERFGEILRSCRKRIGPWRETLGSYVRLPSRVGKAVTQDEVAEAVGISREWYWMIEHDRARVSAVVLGRIADALLIDPLERAALFRLAVPELRSTSLTDRSTAMLDAFGSLRRLTKRLWRATTEAEALTFVREHMMTELAPDAAVTFTRLGEGCWDRAATWLAEKDDPGKRVLALVGERWGATAVDDVLCYKLLLQPGELMTRSERDALFPDIAAKHRIALDAVGWADITFALAHVRSQHGFDARIAVRHGTSHAFSETERAQLSALADLTSLALSACI